MTRRTLLLAEEISTLSTKDRAELAFLILENLNTADVDQEAVTKAWSKELKSRREDVRTGKVKCIDGDTVLRSVRNRKK